MRNPLCESVKEWRPWPVTSNSTDLSLYLISLLSFPASPAHYSTCPIKGIKPYNTLCSILLDKKALIVLIMASDKCLHWYRGCPWLNSAFPQIRTSSWTLPFCASVYRGSLYLSASHYIWGGYQRQSCCSFSLSQKKSGLTRQWPELTRCLLKICDRPSQWPSSKSDQRKWMPLQSSGVFVCGSHLREKKNNYCIVYLLIDTEVGTGGSAMATRSLSD